MMTRMPSDSQDVDPPTLVNIALDLQIAICTLLHPSDILALRVTCKTLQLPTWQRAVWVAVLHRVCIDNSLFLPSFPIVDMSDVELEHAARGPRRWIELCAALQKHHPNDPSATLWPSSTRIIDDPLAAAGRPEYVMVPGGRYIVSCSHNGLFVWDLGYASSADCKLLASVISEGGPIDGYYSCMVEATQDGMGLIILASRLYKQCTVYEIYPQSETPQLTRIAHLDSDRQLPTKPWGCLLSDRVLWYRTIDDSIIFSIWDYRKNYSISFAGYVDFEKLEYDFKVIATKTAIFVLCLQEILVWAIPPLSPQPPDFLNHNITHIPSLFGIAYPDGIVNPYQFVASQTMFHWYYNSSQPLYFAILCEELKLHIFEIILGPNLFDTSLRFINTELVPYDLPVAFEMYSICEDTLVTCWDSGVPVQFAAVTLSRFTTVHSHGGLATKVLLSSTSSGYYPALCPASGRYVHLDTDICRIVVVDLF